MVFLSGEKAGATEQQQERQPQPQKPAVQENTSVRNAETALEQRRLLTSSAGIAPKP